MPVTAVGAEPGAAAARKLARSVFTKGQAAAIGEALEAAEPARLRGLALREHREHARRRRRPRCCAGSWRAAAATPGGGSTRWPPPWRMLEELGVEPRVAAASEAWLRSLVGSEVAR